MPASSSSHQHRASSSLRQSNKKNKRSSASKRSVHRINGGRVNVNNNNSGGVTSLKKSTGKKAGASAHNKERRLLLAKQRRDVQRKRLVDTRRVGSGTSSSGGGIDHVPRLVGVISLTAENDNQAEAWENTVPGLLRQQQQQQGGPSDKNADNTFEFASFPKRKLTVLTNTSTAVNSPSFSCHYSKQQRNDGDSAILGALDLCRVCDIIIFTVNGDVVLETVEQQKQALQNNFSSTMSVKSTTSTNTTTTDVCASLFISDRGEQILSACKAQGLPTVLTLLTHSDGTTTTTTTSMDGTTTIVAASPLHHKEQAKLSKRKGEMKRFGQRLATAEFGEHVRFMDVTTSSSSTSMKSDNTNNANTSSLLRFLCTGTASPPRWVDAVPRPYLVSLSSSSSSNPPRSTEYDAATQQLTLAGHVRGTAPLCINDPVHVPHLGTYRVSRIVVTHTGEVVRPSLTTHTGTEDGMFATPDALEGEQNLIGFDDDADDDKSHASNPPEEDEVQPPAARPAGWSEYQSAWLDGIDTEEKGPDMLLDHGELARSLNTKGHEHEDDLTMDLDDDHDKDELERRRTNDLHFPDEVELSQTELARDRLARYRSLSSFRKSHWDAKENLPGDYGRVYHFASFKHTQRDVMAEREDMVRAMLDQGDKHAAAPSEDKDGMEEEEDDDDDILEGCVFPGTHVTLVLADVPAHLYEQQLSSTATVTAVSLLPHENKVSVLHMGITSKYDGATTATTPNNGGSSSSVIKSKDVLTFRCGWRTWQGRPVFSQNNLNSDKHKLERFLPPSGAFLAATVYGPVCYSPCPVLCFCRGGSGGRSSSSTPPPPQQQQQEPSKLVAVGSTMGADADRIVIKRVVMTGYPTRVHKRHATVKYMFYNPEDVKWFKPAGLTSKHGLQGNIMESVGDHGTMKCLFNKPIKQHDTVCLPLYKRIYPKFAPQPVVVLDSQEEDKSHPNKNREHKTVMRDLVVL